MKLLPKLVLLNVTTALAAMLLLYFAAVWNAQTALESATREQLSVLLKERKSQINIYLNGLRRELTLFAGLEFTQQAIKGLTTEFSSTETSPFTLQNGYIIQNPHPEKEKKRLFHSGMAGSYDDIHQRFHKRFIDWQESSGLLDIYLIDTQGNVVYSVSKNNDFATNLLTGPWKTTGLAMAYSLALNQGTVNGFAFSGFRSYEPSGGGRSGFLAIPIFDSSGMAGVLAFEVSLQALNEIMSNYSGLGDTGDAYLIGINKLTLTIRRFEEQDSNTQLTLFNVKSAALAFNGESGVIKELNYRGKPVITAYSSISPFPSAISEEPVRWAIMAEIEQDEAYHSINSLSENVLLLTVLFATLTILLAALASKKISQPIVHIQHALSDLSEGKNVEIPEINRADEIGAMAKAAQRFKLLAAVTARQSKQERITNLLSLLMSEKDAEAISSYEVPELLQKELDIPFIAFYRKNKSTETEHGRLSLEVVLGLDKRNFSATEFKLGEGLVGQCARERKPILISPAPAGMLEVSSGVGKGSVNHILYCPIQYSETLFGVLEMGFVALPSESHMELIEHICERLGLFTKTQMATIENRKLLTRSQQQSEELRASQTAINQTNAELTSQAEELRAQAEELKATEEELRAQQEELSKKNIALQDAQQRAENRANELDQVSRFKSEFLANMSHELRTPLNSILILSQDLADNPKKNLDEDQIESASVIRDSGSSLLRLINDILDLSKIEAGKLEIHNEWFDLNQTIHYLKGLFAPQAQKKGIGFAIESTSGIGMFHSDPHRLNQILNNLVSNAIKFTESGTVTVRFAQSDNELTVDIVDTGIGIAEHNIQHVFGAFNQADGSTSRKYGGTGLGLAITKHLAIMLGGDVSARSTLGEGSVFTLAIKSAGAILNDSSDAEIPTPTHNTTVTQALVKPEKQSKIKILVVEDDVRLTRVLERMLDSMGIDVDIANTGESALTKADSTSYSGILLDLGLPGISGYDVLKQLPGLGKDIIPPVVIMSGREDTGEAAELGAIDYLSKPVTKNAIANAINKIVKEGTKRISGPRTTNETQYPVLLIEDDKILVSALKNRLKSVGLAAEQAESAEDATQKLAQQQFCALILDFSLPGMSALEWLKQINNIDDLPPLIIYSARDLTEEEHLALCQFTDTIIVKTENSIERLIEELCHKLETPSKPEKHRTNRKNGRILLVDDDSRNLYAVSKVLRQRGYDLTLANSAKAAIEALGQSKFDLLATDIMMPEMDGYELIRYLRSNGYETLPIIALTAKAMATDRQKCLDIGANDYLSKPIDIDTLTEKLDTWL